MVVFSMPQFDWRSILSTLVFSLFQFTGIANADEFTPDFLGAQLSAAEIVATEAGIVIQVQRQESPDRFDEIIRQIPEAGELLGATREVLLYVSNGLIVPNLLGMAQTEAEAELLRLGFSWELNNRPIRQVAVGFVGGLIPTAGTRIDPTRKVVFVVVSSAFIALIPPNIAEMSPQAARQQLEAQGLIVSYDTEFRDNIFDICTGSTYFSYTVIGSQPAPGTEVPRGGHVKLLLKEASTYIPGGPCSPGGVPY